MARYSLNLPTDLKTAAERWAADQGVSLNQFILWAVAEKVGGLDTDLDDPVHPQITYRRGAGGVPTAVIRGTRLSVKAVVVAAHRWGWPSAEIAVQYGVTAPQVEVALRFYDDHRREIDADLAAEAEIEKQSA